ncbi:hypothetical protein F8388_019769 [Cannabis sativa]|uniref:Zinc knuckle CX2CX4HX4C domain-containing protein n=1 Tax=Cannabis sativa TaxID=3483 RepID=A0A7J6EVZ4_CANSA|nr:hypothetical protein F8388_019769 [Cannabis sativa]
MASSSNGEQLTQQWADICLEEEEDHEFYHEIDIQRVLEGSPWTYDRKQMIIQRLTPGENLKMVVLNSLDMWVQIHGLMTGFKTDWALREAAKYIGTLVASDPNNFSRVWRDYLRMRVTINVVEPSKRRMKFRKRNGEAFYAYFKYERVPTFCFICGVTGHAERFCNKVYDIPTDQIVKPYSLDMKAPTRRQNFLTASPWLCSGKEDHRDEHQGSPSTAANNSPVMNARPNYQAKSIANLHPVIAQSQNSGKQYFPHNDHVILVNENTAAYSNEELIEISDLKRKRKEANLSSGAELLTEERMETDVETGPNNSAIVCHFYTSWTHQQHCQLPSANEHKLLGY